MARKAKNAGSRPLGRHKRPVPPPWRDKTHHLWRLIGHQVHAPKATITALLIGYGLLLIGLSSAVGVASHMVTSPGGVGQREVGFLHAPNWSITAVAIWPAMFFVLRSLIDAADMIFRDLDRSPMAWLAVDAPGHTIASTWARHKVILRRVTVLGLALALGVSIMEWWEFSGTTLLAGRPPAEGEYDWSSIPAAEGLRHAQAGFSFLVFLYQGVAITLMISFAAATVLIARTIGLHGTGQTRPALLIDVESNDSMNRAGFERWMIAMDYMIAFLAMAFVAQFLSRIQGEYLRAPNQRSIMEFLSTEIPSPTLSGLGNLLTVDQVKDFSAFGAAAATLVMFACLFYFHVTLKHSALQAKSRSDHDFRRGELLQKAEAIGMSREEVLTKLTSARVWPLGYGDLVPMLLVFGICVVMLIFYRIAFYYVVLWIVGWLLASKGAGFLKKA